MFKLKLHINANITLNKLINNDLPIYNLIKSTKKYIAL